MQEKNKKTQEAHDEKLRMLGELSGGIVHEISSPLSSITLNAEKIECLISDFKEEKQFNDSAEVDCESVINTTQSIIKETERIGHLLNSINHFSKPQEVGVFPLSDVSRIVEESKYLVNYFLTKYNTSFLYQENENLVNILKSVEINPSFLIHALVNLIKNSCEALDRNNQKNRWVRIFTLLSENELIIAVQDSGIKDSEEIQKKYFEPGFTKKPNGSGLGLNFSKNLLETSGGKLEFVPSAETTMVRIVLNLRNEQ